MMTPPTTPRRRDAAATRKALLVAARNLLLNHDAEKVSTRDIASTAGVNQTLVYRYFGSKNALLQEAAQTHIPPELIRETEIRDLPRVLLARMLTASSEDSEFADHSVGLASFVRTSNYEVVRESIRHGISTSFTDELAQRLSGADTELRAELAAAVLFGVALLRENFKTPALSEAEYRTLEDRVDAVCMPLLIPADDDTPPRRRQ